MRPIDADSAKSSVSDYKIFRCQLGGLMDVAEFIGDQPTIDAVPVVRCRECKYRFKNNGHDKSGCPIIDANIWMDDDDFCSHGERKEGAE